MHPLRVSLGHMATIAALCAAPSLQAQIAASGAAGVSGATSASGTAGTSGVSTGAFGLGSGASTANATQTFGAPSAAGQGAGSNGLPSGMGTATDATTEAGNESKKTLTDAPAVKDITAEQTEFQRFVLEGTGKALPLFGYSLFSQPGQYAPVLSAPVPGSYVLGPGDELLLQTFGLVDVAERLVLDREGKVSIPKVGPLVLAGMPFAEAEKALIAHLGKVYTNFTLSLGMGRVRSIEVFVVGQARRPGKHVVSGLSTLINAMFETGGPSANGTLRQVQLRRGGRTIASVDLYQFLASGETSADVKLQSGDIIVIPPAGARAAILGTVNAPAIYELKAGETIQDMLSLSGGLPTLASPQKVVLERLNPQRDVPRYVEDFALDTNGLKRPLQAGDVLTVFQISPQIANTVTLQGHVAAPMRHTFQAGMKVADLLGDPRLLIPNSYWLQVNQGGSPLTQPQVNLDYATIKRFDAATLTSKLINFNLGKAMAKDAAHNMTLQPGDVVTVYSSNDLAVPIEKRFQQVTLEGEVNIPGTYQIQPGETLQQVLERAGGLTRNAYVYGATFTREATRRQQQENLDKALRRAEAEINAQTVTLLQNQTKDNTASLQGQMLLQRQELSRLQSLRANGRIALETSPFSSELPPLKLQGGDRIQIPSALDSVNVIGAVLSESAFMHRPNETVGDYLDRAGVTQFADLDGLMVIRANGSVESAARQTVMRTLWGKGSGLQSQTVFPGDTIFVPERVDRRTAYTRFIEGAKDWTQLLYQFGLGAAAFKVIRNN